MQKTLGILVVGLLLAVGVGVHAGGYNDAGCGIGAYVFKENTKGKQLVASTIDAFIGFKSSSITTGTFGCAPNATAMKQRQKKIFVAVNFRSLSRELAAGEGEYASTFASLMGCRGESADNFLSMTKKSYSTLFPADGTTPEKLLQNIEGRVAADQTLSTSCTL